MQVLAEVLQAATARLGHAAFRSLLKGCAARIDEQFMHDVYILARTCSICWRHEAWVTARATFCVLQAICRTLLQRMHTSTRAERAGTGRAMAANLCYGCRSSTARWKAFRASLQVCCLRAALLWRALPQTKLQ
jgi:hypothetical protein